MAKIQMILPTAVNSTLEDATTRRWRMKVSAVSLAELELSESRLVNDRCRICLFLIFRFFFFLLCSLYVCVGGAHGG